MKKILCAMMLFVAAILCLHQNVSAAEGATVTVNGDTLQAGSDAWKVTLDISGDAKITNGKIRVTYDSSQLKLVSTEAGSMMNGVLTDINDPVSGNKSEGEAVFVFASSAELDTNGTLFEMTFQVLDSVKDGDSVTIIKDLKVKGSSSMLKIGTKVKNIRLVEGDHNIDCKIDGFGPMKLKSEFVKKN